VTKLAVGAGQAIGQRQFSTAVPKTVSSINLGQRALKYLSAHGANIPLIGLGTWALGGSECARVVAEAIALGYRHIDTAASYGNESAVGEGMRASGTDRDKLFVTTKVPESSLGDGGCQRAVEASLSRLGLDRVDLVLIHWPNRRMSAADMIKPLGEVEHRGLTRHIGVSNFNVVLLEEAWQASRVPIVANQCEYHPYLNQDRLLAACRRLGTAFISYCPLGRTNAFAEPVIAKLAKAKARTPAEIVLRWHIQQDGVAAIPKTRSRERLRENLAVFDFVLSEVEMGEISALTSRHARLPVHLAERDPDRICDSSWPRWDP
jgi:diketogulonate reductase-like aldo/keto reductase